MSTDTINAVTAEELFTWWSGLQTAATIGTTRDDWDVVGFRDAWCFFRRVHPDNEAYLIRGTSLIHFGLDDDTLESAYELLVRSSLRPSNDTRARRRRR